MTEIYPGFKRERIYTFEQNPGGPGVICEDITVAATLLCDTFERVNKVDKEEFPAARFAGTLHARDTKSGEKIFLFVIIGDTVSLFRRQRLFHGGALRVDPKDYKAKRSYLMDALADAKDGEAVGRRMIPFKETIHAGKIQGQDSVCPVGNGCSDGSDVRSGPVGSSDIGSPVEGTTGGGGK
jgi:hypothetical protein